MIKTIIFSDSVFPVPSEWIFKYILNLQEDLTGQTITIKSVFNNNDKTPSMKIFYYEKDYRFKDFSSGHYGDAVHLYMLLENISDRIIAKQKLFELYKQKANGYENTAKHIEIKKEVSAFTIRKWNTLDQTYWKKRFTSSKELSYMNIKALSSYTITITTNDNVNVFTQEPLLCYGFFNKAGELCKIYNPGKKKGKYIKVKSFIQGHDQLRYDKKWLIIASSTKEIIHLTKLFGNILECIAPESENCFLTDKQVSYYKSKYKLISTLFDNDEAGIKGALHYKNTFNIPGILFNVEKDIDECVVQHGLNNTKLFLKPLLKEHYEREIKRTNIIRQH